MAKAAGAEWWVPRTRRSRQRLARKQQKRDAIRFEELYARVMFDNTVLAPGFVERLSDFMQCTSSATFGHQRDEKDGDFTHVFTSNEVRTASCADTVV